MLEKTVFAIDGGLNGHICMLHGSRVLMSKIPTAKGRLSTSVLHLDKMQLKDYRPKEFLRLVDQAIEIDDKVQFFMEEPPPRVSSRGSGAHSILFQWRGLGMWSAIVGLRGRVIYLVSPQTWKAAYGLRSKGKSDVKHKRDALELAKKLYPSVRFQSIDAADACLLATYARNQTDISVVGA